MDNMTILDLNTKMKTDAATRIALLTAALMFLFAGILIYVLFRDSDLLVFKVIGKPAFLAQAHRRDTVEQMLNVLVYNVPDGLWLLSGILCLRALWLKQAAQSRMYVLIFCVIALLFEVAQVFANVPGTFDVGDMLTIIIVAFTEGVFYKNFMRRSVKYA